MTHLCHCATLVVPSDELDAVRIPQFETGQERDGLDAEQASVDVVAEEEVVGMGRVASYPEDLDQVIELAARPEGRVQVARVAKDVGRARGEEESGGFFPSVQHAQADRSEERESESHPPMDVSDDGDGCLDVDDVALAHQELLCLFANLFEERLPE